MKVEINCIVLYCIVSYRIVSYRIVSYRIVLYCIVLYCIVLYCIVHVGLQLFLPLIEGLFLISWFAVMKRECKRMGKRLWNPIIRIGL